MELIDNKALRISVPHELAREIQQRIFKVEVLEKRENLMRPALVKHLVCYGHPIT